MIVTVKEAREKLDKLPDNAVVFMDVIDLITLEHEPGRRMNCDECNKLLDLAEKIKYEDNIFFGMFSLSGIRKNNIHNLLFPQKE